MKKKFLIPIAGVFLMTLAFSFSGNSELSSSEEMSNLFVSSDNIAFTESGNCGSWFRTVCLKNGTYWYNQYKMN
tara:strand:+ start:681 stop:902 length:222 start_codon:yes stop_codon:yes gene_type:complete